MRHTSFESCATYSVQVVLADMPTASLTLSHGIARTECGVEVEYFRANPRIVEDKRLSAAWATLARNLVALLALPVPSWFVLMLEVRRCNCSHTMHSALGHAYATTSARHV